MLCSNLVSNPSIYRKNFSTSRYFLQTNYNSQKYIWEAEFDVKKSEVQQEIYIFNFELEPFTIRDSVLKRMVFTEKKGCEKTIEILEDPLKSWSIQTMFSSNFSILEKDFILFEIKNNDVIKTFFLSGCRIIDSSEWSTSTDFKRNLKGIFKISFIPKTILQIP